MSEKFIVKDYRNIVKKPFTSRVESSDNSAKTIAYARTIGRYDRAVVDAYMTKSNPARKRVIESKVRYGKIAHDILMPTRIARVVVALPRYALAHAEMKIDNAIGDKVGKKTSTLIKSPLIVTRLALSITESTIAMAEAIIESPKYAIPPIKKKISAIQEAREEAKKIAKQISSTNRDSVSFSMETSRSTVKKSSQKNQRSL